MDYQAVLEEIREEVRPHFGKGKVAGYIPALARVAPDRFGMAVETVDGRSAAVGDAGVPRNPFIDAGTLVVADRLLSVTPEPERLLRDYMRLLSANPALDLDLVVARLERRRAHANAALLHLMKAHGRIVNEVKPVLDLCRHQCSLAMSCADLARACLPLAAKGFSRLLQESVLTAGQARRINALMLTCGMYVRPTGASPAARQGSERGGAGRILVVMPPFERSMA